MQLPVPMQVLSPPMQVPLPMQCLDALGQVLNPSMHLPLPMQCRDAQGKVLHPLMQLPLPMQCRDAPVQMLCPSMQLPAPTARKFFGKLPAASRAGAWQTELQKPTQEVAPLAAAADGAERRRLKMGRALLVDALLEGEVLDAAAAPGASSAGGAGSAVGTAVRSWEFPLPPGPVAAAGAVVSVAACVPVCPAAGVAAGGLPSRRGGRGGGRI